MKVVNYQNNKLTWQAKAVMDIETMCIETKKYPNGTRMNKTDIEKSNQIITDCIELLNKYGCIDLQLKLL